MIKYVIIILSTAFLSSCFGQSDSAGTETDSIQIQTSNDLPMVYPIELNENYMEVVDTAAMKIFNAQHLAPFFKQLHAVERGKNTKVKIAHIGDSHIQADFLTGQMRMHFQRDFGNGGRGLIFPYKLAHTNGPLDFAITSDVDWKGKRNVFPQMPGAIGVSGITITTEKEHYHLQIRIDSNDAIDSVVVFHQGPEENPFTIYQTDDNHLVEKHSTVTKTKYHKIKSGESVSVIADKYNVSPRQLSQWNGIRNNRIYAGKSLKILTVAKESRPIGKDEMEPITGSHHYQPSQFAFKVEPSNYQVVLAYEGPKNHAINGVYVDKNEPGVVYNMIGVNGAKFEHYNVSENFQEQFQALQSNLIVVALGTNESLDHHYDSARLAMEFTRFITDLKARNPNAGFIISLNPDAYSRRKQNPDAKRLNGIMKQLCVKYDLPYFDAFQLMGRQGGMYQWYQKGLSNRDLVHLNGKGYRFMADLFYTAIMNAYLEYQADVGVN